ncbi:MAG: leucyl/phenylalanyl-tRNA--protein transferase [Spirochaetaceae bacterium]|nr:leucyl/phenylalanyl-tRNA--protein transferase [Spirochaetaceae bacterium]
MDFPNPLDIKGDLIAVGGNLSVETLLRAYSRGIFPWYSDGDPILWWSLNPRFVIFPERFHLSSSLRKRIKKNPFKLTLDRAFDQVIAGCRNIDRPDQEGTWITDEMMEAYIQLHLQGYAHSVEAWIDGELAGGLYGVSLGGCYYGESMFTRQSDASKIAFSALGGVLIDSGFGLIDCQQHTRHLAAFGAVDMPRRNFLNTLSEEVNKPTIKGNWGEYFPDFPNSSLWGSLNGQVIL